MSAKLSTAVVAAWQSALAAEQEAVFGYQLIGPHLSVADQARAAQGESAHSTLRDATAVALLNAGETPQAGAADYPDLPSVDSTQAARGVAIGLEDRCAAAWRYLYAQAAARPPDVTTTAVRRSAQAALTASAVAATQWRIIADRSPYVTAFPGIS
jgi:hypothetical protein